MHGVLENYSPQQIATYQDTNISNTCAQRLSLLRIKTV